MVVSCTPRKQKAPVWAWRIKQSALKLHELLDDLQHTAEDQVSDCMLESHQIELHKLSFKTGATCRSGQTYFMPRDDGSCNTANSQRIPMFGFDDFMTSQQKNADSDEDVDLHPYLASAFRKYAFDLYRKAGCKPGWAPALRGKYEVSDSTEVDTDPFLAPFKVFRGMRSANTHQCHRQVWMQSEVEPDEDRPSRGELMVLFSWMLGAMSFQRGFMKPCTRKRHSVKHHVFPTMVISFLPLASARVLYGYFDGTFKVHYTKVQEFNVPNYVQMMDSLLQWAWPLLSGRTSTVIPMPTITESEEESNVEENEKSGLSRASKKRRLKKRVICFAAGLSRKRKRQDPLQKGHHVCQLGDSIGISCV